MGLWTTIAARYSIAVVTVARLLLEIQVGGGGALLVAMIVFSWLCSADKIQGHDQSFV
jgi:hypothetical protein